MKREIKKLTKQEKEQIDNRLVIVFATALGAIMLLMYLMNWFKGSGGFAMSARIITYIVLVGSIAASILFSIISKKASAKNQLERAEKYKSWKWVVVASAICSFIIYPTEIIGLFKWIGLPEAAYQAIIRPINSFRFFGFFNIDARIIVIMTLVAIATIAIFVYYGIYLNKCHKSSLNKGSKKAK